MLAVQPQSEWGTGRAIIMKAREGDVVLLFGAKDEEHNNAVALKEYIDSRMGM
jgi:uncharacterized protein YeaO (DUF488 family)